MRIGRSLINALYNYYIRLYNDPMNYKYKPILMLGPPGIGKSEIAFQLAEELAKHFKRELVVYDERMFEELYNNVDKYFIFFDIRLYEIEPSDFMIPAKKNGEYSFEPLKITKLLSNPKTYGILFLDEITNIQRNDQLTLLFKILLDKMIGFYKISPYVKIIAAGNPPEMSSIAQLLPAPIVDRLLIKEIDPPTIEEWTVYMEEKYPKYNRIVLAYLKTFPSDFIKIPKEASTLKNFPTPRTWTQVAILLDDNSDMNYMELVSSMLGDEVGTKFLRFLEEYKELNLDLYINKPEKLHTLKEKQVIKVCYLLALKLSEMEFNDKNFLKILRTLLEMGKIGKEYVTFFMRLVRTKDRMKEFVEMLLKYDDRPEAKEILELYTSIARIIGSIKV